MADVNLAPSSRPAAPAGVEADTVVRSVLFLAAILLAWISLHPFQDRSQPQLDITDGGNFVNQIGYASMFLLLAAWTFFNDANRLKPLLRPALVVMLAWFALTVVTSWEPGLSARRLAFTIIVLGIAGMTLLLPKNVRHFADLLAAATLIVLVLSYFGVLLVPDLAVHQTSDFLEPEHAGSWRGLFPHKNEAGGMMVVFIFIGLFVARLRSVAVGGTIAVLALVFLVLSHSKTSIALLPCVLIVAAIAGRTRRPIVGMVMTIGGLVVLNIVSIGSVYSDAVREVLGQVMDPSFTGRTDIWQFAFDQLAQRPITGYGFLAFWGTERVVYGLGQSFTWASNATDAHNAYVNLAVTVGIVGLVPALLWSVVLPVSDFYRRSAQPDDRLLATLFLRTWLFGIYASSFESALFQPVGELWFIFLIAIYGLRCLSLARVKS